jgi:L-fuculose-phosphate aldolase
LIIQDFSPNKNENLLRRALALAGQRCYETEFLSSFDGNLSVRLHGNRYLISAAGKNKGRLQPEDVVLVNGIGTPIRMGLRPSTEVFLHTLVYERRSDAGAIIHAHPVYSVLLSFATSLSQPFIDDSIFFPRPVVIAPYAIPTTQSLPQSIRQVIDDFDIIVLSRHGSLTIGRNLDEAFEKLVYLERQAKLKVQSLCRQ